MSSIFGTSVDDQNLGLNSTFLVGVTNVNEAIQILDQQLTILNESNLTNDVSAPLNDVINLMNQRITDVADGLSNNLTAINVKTLYESNPDTNAFTDAYKTIVDNVGDYIDASELATALTPYRIATDQDTIDSGKYSTSNPSGYQTSSQVINSISDALTPYRTSADQDIIDGTHLQSSALTPYRLAADQDTIDVTKLNSADLKSDIVLHPSTSATFLGIACCGGLNTTGMARTSTGDITPFSVIPQFPSSDSYSDLCNGVVNFKGSNYYSYQAASGKAYTVEIGGVYTNVSASTIFTTETATNDFVYKFATNGQILVAISKDNNSVHTFWTLDGITWTPYFDNYTGGKRELQIYDDIIYIGTTSDILILSVADIQANVAYTMHNTGGLINSIVKIGPTTFVYLNENGMWVSDLISGASAATGFPTGASLAYESPGKITVAPWGLYANTGTVDNNIYKSIDGGFNWSLILTAAGDFNEVKTVFYSSDINVILVGGYTNTSTLLTLDSVDTTVYYPTGLDTNKQDTGTYYIFGFGNTYSGGGGASGITVLKDSGANTTNNVYDSLNDLSTANTELRTSLGSYAQSADVTSEIAADRASQDASIALTYTSNATASATYLTILNAQSQYQSVAGMASYSTTSQMNTAITNANNTQDASIASTYYLQTNPSGYITSSALAPYSTTSQMNTAITNANNTQDSTIASTYYLQTNPAGYITSSALVPYITSATAASTYATLTQLSYLARTNVKVVQLTNSSTTPASGQAYSTIASALAAASSGQIVFAMPGVYNETGLTIPAGVELRGLSRFSCIISPTPTTSTTVITIGGANCKITDITIQSTSTTNGCNQTGVSVSSTYNTTLFMRNVNVNITGNIADTDTADAICLDSTATGAHANDSIFNYIDCVFKCDANGLGVKRCVRSTGVNSDLHFDTCQFSCVRGTAGSDYIAFEVNGTSADSQLTNCYLSGFNNDISATNGIIQLGKSTILANSTTNGKSILVFGGDITYVGCNEGVLGAGTSYLSFGGSFSGNEKRLYFPRKCVVYGLTYSNRLSTSSDNTVITVRKNGVDTTLTLNMTAASLYGTNTTTGITFNSGDYISVKIVRGTGTITDTNIQFSTY